MRLRLSDKKRVERDKVAGHVEATNRAKGAIGGYPHENSWFAQGSALPTREQQQQRGFGSNEIIMGAVMCKRQTGSGPSIHFNRKKGIDLYTKE